MHPNQSEDTCGELSAILNKQPAQTLRIRRSEGESEQDALARAMTNSRFTAALTTQCYSRFDGEQLDISGLVNALDAQIKAVNAGDLSEQEAMLTAQSKTLDAIFNNLARRAALNFTEYPAAADTFMRLALKAQSQCRSTVEALAEVKNPRPVAFVKQANIANGPQQVNNGQQSISPARENEIAPKELLRIPHAEPMYIGTPSTAGGVDKELAAVGKLHRAA